MNNPYQPPQSDLIVEEHQDTRLAPRGLRFWGAMLDGLLVGIPGGALGYTLGVYDHIGANGAMPLHDHLLAIVIGITLFVVINGYLIYTRGQTVGKLVCRTRVVSADGTQVSGNRYMFRRLAPMWVITQIPIIGSLLSLLDVALIFRKDHKCLHDHIAGTTVVRVPQPNTNNSDMV